ncbi:MAG TPA: cupin-like domain-containing protein, partial [Rhizomicrobium sp.]
MTQRVGEISSADISSPEIFLREIVAPCRPVVLRGLVRDWPVVTAGRAPAALRDYLAGFAIGAEMEVFAGAPHIAGKYYYNDDLQGFNFERRRM